MSKLLWQMCKTAPVVLTSSLLLVSGAQAALEGETESAESLASVVQPAEIESAEPLASVAQETELEGATEFTFESPAPSVEIAQDMGYSSNSELLQQIESYGSEGSGSSLGQSAQGASKFRDVRPTDWAFQALDDLINRYDCLVGYPDGTFRGNRPLTRYEFAAGLNACLNQIERLIAEATADFVTREDLETLRRLLQEFEAELATLGTRVDNLEARTAFLEDHQFSTTTKLKGEVIFGLADIFTDTDQQFDTNFNRVIDAEDNAPQGGNTTLGYRARLNFQTSFTGKDLLRARLQARNIQTFAGLGNASNAPTFANNGNFTREGRIGFEGDTGGSVVLDDLFYRFPILGDRGRFQVWANGSELNDIFDPINPMASSGSGALSRFGRFNPIYRSGSQNAAVALDVQVADWINVAGAYTADEANESGSGAGLFNGDYAVSGQVTLEPFDGRMKIAGLFVHSYRATSGFGTGTGTLASQFRVRNEAVTGSTSRRVPTVSNSYGVNVNFEVTDNIFVGGWGGYTHARAINTGDGDIWNWAGYVGIDDFGLEGSRLGFIVGREPYLAGSDPNIGLTSTDGLGNALGNRADDDSSYHFEALYRIAVNKNIRITPGVIVITNPGAQSVNDTLWIGVLRTTFTF
ncbi:MAG: iron uptake porin [Cyanobacteriota bacterium]|nr:iron uptake porin [Cyanobacteriota bacterium]